MNSLSAYALSSVTSWRNPQGEQGNWIHEEQTHIMRPSLWKRVKAEGCYAVLTVVSTSECALAKVAYSFSRNYRDWYETSKAARKMSITYLSENWRAANLPTDVFELRRRQNGIPRIIITDPSRPILLTQSGQGHQE